MQTVNRLTTILVLTTILASTTMFAQTDSSAASDNTINFLQLSDSIIKFETALFNIKGQRHIKVDSVIKTHLKEIPIRNCDSQSVYFQIKDTYIDINFKGEGTSRQINSISLVTHSHLRSRFPDNAFHGLNQPNSCNYKSVGKKSSFSSPYFKAYYSSDSNRIYIYMQGGTNSHKYEVTWVFINCQYSIRILDTIP